MPETTPQDPVEPQADAPVEPQADADGALVYYGEPVKVLKTATKEDGTEVVTLGGHLVVFSGPDSPDLEGDFFTAATDFGTLSRRKSATVPAYYQHGFDPHFKNAALGDAELSVDEFGVWAEYQLELRSAYERHLVDMARKGKMGQSSGAVAHLVERQKTAKGDAAAYHFKSWPIGEASLTPTPAEPRTSALPLKAFKAALPDAPAEPDTAALTAAIERLTDAVTSAKQAPPDAPATPQDTTSVQDEPQDAPAPATPTPTPETAMSDQNTKTADPAVPQDTNEAEAKAEAKNAPEQKDGSAIITLDQVEALVAKQMKALREDLKPGAPMDLNTTKGAPAILTTGLGDSELKAFAHFVKTGRENSAMKASNATDMNIGTDADGGYAVPTGHYQGIIAKRDEDMLRNRLGCMAIPGQGTTVNVPIDNEADGEFVSTSEAADGDLDAPALSEVAMTLVKYTKRVVLSNELLQDEDSRIMAFLDDFVGRGSAKTHNSLLVAAVEAGGTSLKTFASATAIADGELEDIYYSIKDEYGDNFNWVTRRATEGAIRKLKGDDRKYESNPQGSGAGRDLLGAPIYNSEKVDAIGASGKSVLFGNFGRVGYREAPGMTVLRDPYSLAIKGQIVLHYYFRTVYKVLTAEAVGYGAHPSA